MKSLTSLIDTLPAALVIRSAGSLHGREVTGITCDSRVVRPGHVFVALKGAEADGHDYVVSAMELGCCAVVVEQEPTQLLDPKIPVIRVTDSHQVLGLLAAAWQDMPAAAMTLIGLTGTNGKTTTSWLIEEILQTAGKRTGVIGTVNYRYPDRHGNPVVRNADLTTPDPLRLQQLLRQMADSGVTHVVMEASSHALVGRRLAGVAFDVAVFTNLSRDHLDFHHTMDDYFAAKKLLFDQYLKPDGTAVVVTEAAGTDQDRGRQLKEHLAGAGKKVLTCGFDADCDVTVTEFRQSIDGISGSLSLAVVSCRLHSPLIGRFNMLNMLAAAGAGHCLGIETQTLCQGLSLVQSVPGRLERVRLPGREQAAPMPAVFVDYAHTPDALENVLSTVRGLATGRLICVFGCGGDRDHGKRPLMGAIGGRLADVVIVTSDNPRRENPLAIIEDILPGMRSAGRTEQKVEELFSPLDPLQGYTVMEDRREAIRIGCCMAAPEDVVVLAGKGHETYQIRGTRKSFFDDRLQVRDSLLSWNERHLLAATGGKKKLCLNHCLLLSGRVVTDTRKLAAGDIFVALHGDNFDGHDFAAAAVEAGARALIVHRDVRIPTDREILVIRVKNTEQALGDLAGYRRRLLAPDLQVAAITGSSGKTTVKEMTATVFSGHWQDQGAPQKPVLKTSGNFNNLIGLPLTLLGLRGWQRAAVVEMGMNRPGEIGCLAAIADPDIACITNIQGAHLEGLGSIEGVAQAKGELFATMRGDGIRIVNCDDPLVRRLAARHGGRQVGFAVTGAGRRYRPEVRVTRIMSQGEQGMRFTLHIGDWQQRITVPAPGEHNVSNCAAAAAIAHAAGIAPETIARGLCAFRPIDKRMQYLQLAGGLQVVNDSYNANPASMSAALRTVAGFGNRCRRVAALGDMLELGGETVRAHRRIGALVAELGYDLLAVTGDQADEIAVAAKVGGMAKETVRVFSDTEGIADWLYMLLVSGELVGGDWLLVKGSRGMRMERVIEGLMHRFDTRIGQEL